MDLKFELHDCKKQKVLKNELEWFPFPVCAYFQQMIESNEQFSVRLQHDQILDSINPQILGSAEKQIGFPNTRKYDGYLIEMLFLRINGKPQRIQVERKHLASSEPGERILNAESGEYAKQQYAIKDGSDEDVVELSIVITESDVQPDLNEGRDNESSLHDWCIGDAGFLYLKQYKVYSNCPISEIAQYKGKPADAINIIKQWNHSQRAC